MDTRCQIVCLLLLVAFAIGSTDIWLSRRTQLYLNIEALSSSANPCETHLAFSTVLSDLVAERPLAPITVAIAAVRRASLGALHLVGPSKENELESDMTYSYAAGLRCALRKARNARWQDEVSVEPRSHRGGSL